MEISDVLTLIIAVYGAALSTYNLITTRREKQWRLKVHVSEGVVVYTDNTLRPSVIITARNIGHRNITISSCGFSVLGEKRTYVDMGRETNSAPLPHELAPGKSHQFWLSVDEVTTVLVENGHSGLVNLIGYYSDGIGNTYKSDPYPFEIKSQTSST